MDNAKMVSRGYPRLKGKYSQIAAAAKKIKNKKNSHSRQQLFFQLEFIVTWVNPVKIHLRCFYSVVIANSKLDFFCIFLRPRRPCLLPFGAHGKSALHSVFCLPPITPCALCCTAGQWHLWTREWYSSLHDTDDAFFFCSLW